MNNCFIVNIGKGKHERECRVVTNVTERAFKSTIYRNPKFVYVRFDDLVSGKIFRDESCLMDLVWRAEEIVHGYSFRLKPDDIVDLRGAVFEMTE